MAQCGPELLICSTALVLSPLTLYLRGWLCNASPSPSLSALGGALTSATVLNKPARNVGVPLGLAPEKQNGLPASGLGEPTACHALGLSPAPAGPIALQYGLSVIPATCSSSSAGLLGTGSSLLTIQNFQE